MLSRTPVTRPVSYRVPAWTAAAIGEFKMTVHLLCSSRSTSTTASRARGLCFRLGCASKLIDPSRANQFQPGDAQVEETTAACCPDSICPDNQIPEACSFHCGRVFGFRASAQIGATFEVYIIFRHNRNGVLICIYTFGI